MIGLVTEEGEEGEKAIVRSAPDGSDKNCSELLLANGMGLDRAPIKFQKLGFLKPPNVTMTRKLVDIKYSLALK